MGFLRNLFGKKQPTQTPSSSEPTHAKGGSNVESTISQSNKPTCTRCGKVLEEAANMFPQAKVIGTIPILYKGVICTKCGKIECVNCKGASLQAPCSWCGGKVTPVTEDLLNSKASRKVAHVLILKRGSKPDNDAGYVQQVLKTLAPEVFKSPGVQVRARFLTGSVDQTYVIGAAMTEFGADVGDKYDLWTENFSDADGDGGILLKAFYK